ncbi:hypothetical protein PCE1_003912 [Barthelona sp. PCE]
MSRRGKRVLSGEIVVNNEAKQLSIYYDLQIYLVNADGSRDILETKNSVKKIKLDKVELSTDIDVLTEQILEKCSKILSKKRYNELHQKLEEFQRTLVVEDDLLEYDNESLTTYSAGIYGRDASVYGDINMESVSIDFLEDYLESLYDDIDTQIRSTACIAFLAKTDVNLPKLVENDALLNTMSRLLRESGQKSVQLSSNIMQFFYTLSIFGEYHSVLQTFSISKICIAILKSEVKRFNTKNKNYLEASRLYEMEQNGTRTLDNPMRRKVTAILQNYTPFVNTQNRLIVLALNTLFNMTTTEAFHQALIKAKLFKILTLLLRLGTKLPAQLYVHIYTFSLTFLRVLSVYNSNKEQLKKLETHLELLPLITLFFTDNKMHLLDLTLRILHNMAFDTTVRDSLLKNSDFLVFFSKLALYFINNMERKGYKEMLNIVIRTFYFLSQEPHHAVILGRMPIIVTRLHQMIVSYPQTEIPDVLMSLIVNVVECSFSATKLFCFCGLELDRIKDQFARWDSGEEEEGGGGMELFQGGIFALIERLFVTRQEFLFVLPAALSKSLFKAVHNSVISREEAVLFAKMFLLFFHKIVVFMQEITQPNAVIACMEFMYHITFLNVPAFSRVLVQGGYINYISEAITTSDVDDDILMLSLYIVLLTCTTESNAHLIVTSGILDSLVSKMQTLFTDVEILKVSLELIQNLMCFERSLEFIMSHAELVQLLLFLYGDSDESIQAFLDDIFTLGLSADPTEDRFTVNLTDEQCSLHFPYRTLVPVSEEGTIHTANLLKKRRFEVWNWEWLKWLSTEPAVEDTIPEWDEKYHRYTN